jgi:rhodanese-related sulfurtransferase
VPELEEAFTKGDEAFMTKYGFSKPAKDAANIVVGCRSGRRAVSAIQTLEKIGYNSLMYVHINLHLLTKHICFLYLKLLSLLLGYTKEVSMTG